MNITMQQRGVIVLPKKIRDLFKLDTGSSLRVSSRGDEIVISSATDPVLEEIRKGLQEYREGKYITVSSIDELHEKAKAYAN